ncbi:hypothetical protein L2E82_17372 [Cichorium intybus]|uniref:Uncharacterized protein n=1 Tax=Cichorium intybus TaxID=13427 RepID=A0ACB9F7P9_CICIN|nr:hypothetical protein L2E82_17372 [Cichorium intybus]
MYVLVRNQRSGKSWEYIESLWFKNLLLLLPPVFIVVKKHEFHVKNLEEDLENQARGIEADMEDLVGVKVDQEQKAIRVEENLIKVKLLKMKKYSSK